MGDGQGFGGASLGVQIAPWWPTRDIVAAATSLGTVFDAVWVPDQLLARNVNVLLSAIASTGEIGVASGVAIPLSRNPLDLASAMATLAELVPPASPVIMGMGAGGPLISRLFDKRSATDLLAESIRLIRELWTGVAVKLDEFPVLGERLRWRPGGSAQLTFPVERTIPILAAIGGRRTLELAYAFADGLICGSTYPPLCYAALRSHRFDVAQEISAIGRQRAEENRPFSIVYGLNCCVSADGRAARRFARRQAALVVGNPAVWPELENLGLDLDSARAVHDVLRRGASIEAAGRHVSDTVLDALIVSGTPDACVAQLAELVEVAQRVGFTDFYFGVPLGPELAEAVPLLVNVVVPALWPHRYGAPRDIAQSSRTSGL